MAEHTTIQITQGQHNELTGRKMYDNEPMKAVIGRLLKAGVSEGAGCDDLEARVEQAVMRALSTPQMPHISAADIKAAIEQHDDPDHPDSLTIETIRATLDDIQRSIEDHYGEWVDLMNDGSVELIYEDAEVVVLGDHSGHAWQEELDAAGVEDDILCAVIKSAHMKAAAELADYSWEVVDPIVISKPKGWQMAEQHPQNA